MKKSTLRLLGIVLFCLAACSKQNEERISEVQPRTEPLLTQPLRNTKLYELTVTENSPQELKDYLKRTQVPDYKQTKEDRVIFEKYAVVKQPEAEPGH